MDQQRKIKMGILTIEPHGPSWAEVLKAIPDVELVSIWDYEKAAGQDFAARYDIPFVAEKPEDMLGHVNAVAIAGGRPAPEKGAEVRVTGEYATFKKGLAWGEAPDDHLRLSRPFLSEGLPVLIDKPLADTVEDAVAIVQLARSNRALLMSVSACRYSPEVAALREAVDDGSLGRIIGATYLQGSGISTLEWTLIHSLDTLSSLFGPGMDSVFAMRGGALRVWDREFPHAHGLVIRWRDGRLATVLFLMELADGASNNALPEMTAKTAYPSDYIIPHYVANHRRVIVYGDANWAEATLKSKSNYVHQIGAFLNMIRTGQEPIPLEHTLETIQTMCAAARSAETGQLEKIVPTRELLH
jgi:predicted dehydrogenase